MDVKETNLLIFCHSFSLCETTILALPENIKPVLAQGATLGRLNAIAVKLLKTASLQLMICRLFLVHQHN